jgi:hypothetical protein
MSREFPWWMALNNELLSAKVGYAPIRNVRCLSKLLDLSGLDHVKCMKDCNMGGEYYRFFAYFQGDPLRYFTTFSTWDLPIPYEECKTIKLGECFLVGGLEWKVVKPEYDYIVELKRV